MQLHEGELAWLRWRDVWFMARVSGESDDGPNRLLQLHVLGENEAADKWLSADSALLRPLKELQASDLRVGTLPSRGACVQLLVADATLWPLLSSGEDVESAGIALVGKVFDVIVQRDASVVDVDGPGDKRRVHIGNGYVRLVFCLVQIQAELTSCDIETSAARYLRGHDGVDPTADRSSSCKSHCGDNRAIKSVKQNRLMPHIPKPCGPHHNTLSSLLLRLFLLTFTDSDRSDARRDDSEL